MVTLWRIYLPLVVKSPQLSHKVSYFNNNATTSPKSLTCCRKYTITSPQCLWFCQSMPKIHHKHCCISSLRHSITVISNNVSTCQRVTNEIDFSYSWTFPKIIGTIMILYQYLLILFIPMDFPMLNKYRIVQSAQ